ncbi:VQ domain-containing protein [Psidium guajava]|nr:VQ domain-containing protein [Psidium guajava]
MNKAMSNSPNDWMQFYQQDFLSQVAPSGRAAASEAVSSDRSPSDGSARASASAAAALPASRSPPGGGPGVAADPDHRDEHGHYQLPALVQQFTGGPSAPFGSGPGPGMLSFNFGLGGPGRRASAGRGAWAVGVSRAVPSATAAASSSTAIIPATSEPAVLALSKHQQPRRYLPPTPEARELEIVGRSCLRWFRHGGRPFAPGLFKASFFLLRRQQPEQTTTSSEKLIQYSRRRFIGTTSGALFNQMSRRLSPLH